MKITMLVAETKEHRRCLSAIARDFRPIPVLDGRHRRIGVVLSVKRTRNHLIGDCEMVPLRLPVRASLLDDGLMVEETW